MEELLDFVLFQKEYVTEKKLPFYYSVIFSFILSFAFVLFLLNFKPTVPSMALSLVFILYFTLLGALHIFIKVFLVLMLLKIFSKNIMMGSSEFIKKYVFTYFPLLFLIPAQVIGYHYNTDKGVLLTFFILIIIWKYAIQLVFLKRVSASSFIKNLIIILLSDAGIVILYLLDFTGLLLSIPMLFK